MSQNLAMQPAANLLKVKMARDLSRKQFLTQAKKFGFTPVEVWHRIGLNYFDCTNTQGQKLSISSQPQLYPTHRAQLAELIRALASHNRRLENG